MQIPSAHNDAEPWSERPGWVVALPAGVTLLLALFLSGALTGGLPGIADTDGFMRLVRVDELRSGANSWFDGSAARSNAPFGHAMHWTRPLDVVVLAVALVVGPFVSGDGLLVAASIIGPLTLAGVAAVMTWAAAPLVGRVGAVVAGLGVGLQPTLVAYGGAGRVDHHALIFLATATLLGFAVRVTWDPADRSAVVGAGVTAAAGLWISTEFLLPIGIVLLAFLVAWVVTGAPAVDRLLVLSSTWAAATALVLLIERAPDALTARDLDRVSVVHLLAAALAALFWFLVGAFPFRHRLGRFGAAFAAGLLTASALWWLAPEFAAGPFGDVPPELWDAWLSRVAELQPLWPVGDGPLRTLYLLAAPILGLALCVLATRRSRLPGLWWSVFAAVAGLTALGTLQARFTAFAQLVAVLPLGWLSASLVHRIGSGPGFGFALRRVLAMAAGAAGFLVPVIAVAALQEADPQPPEPAVCEIEALLDYLDEAPGSPVVLTHIDWGPEILFRTDASVLATPYHRNVDGILDARRFLGSVPDVSAAIARDRGADVVAVCPDRDADYLADDRSSGDLLSLIVNGDEPGWLRAVSTSDDLIIFEVDDSRFP